MPARHSPSAPHLEADDVGEDLVDPAAPAADIEARAGRPGATATQPAELAAADPSLRVVDAWPYGDVYVLEHLWRWVGLPELVGEAASRPEDLQLFM